MKQAQNVVWVNQDVECVKLETSTLFGVCVQIGREVRPFLSSRDHFIIQRQLNWTALPPKRKVTECINSSRFNQLLSSLRFQSTANNVVKG